MPRSPLPVVYGDTLDRGYAMPTLGTNLTGYYDPARDPKRLVYNSGLFLGTSLMSIAVYWSLPEHVSNWDRKKILEDGPWNKWKSNIQRGPVWDRDNPFINYVTHPYAGAFYYMSARGSGYNQWQSFTYTALMSTFFWEYGLEAFAEVPSYQDLMLTPLVGAVLGEHFYAIKGRIIRNDRKWHNSRIFGQVALILIDPMNEFLDALGYKTRHKKLDFHSMVVPLTLKGNFTGFQIAMNARF